MSLKKHVNRTRLKRNLYAPLTSSPYQLSVTFAHKFLSRYQHDIFHQSWVMLKQILSDEFVHGRGMSSEWNEGAEFEI